MINFLCLAIQVNEIEKKNPLCTLLVECFKYFK